jgi:hypothetical protein
MTLAGLLTFIIEQAKNALIIIGIGLALKDGAKGKMSKIAFTLIGVGAVWYLLGNYQVVFDGIGGIIGKIFGH